MTQKIPSNSSSTKPSYHHGDLRCTLINEATLILKEYGVEGLSLRKLADRVGVSRTAPYHHFRDKNQLLCTIAEQGFIRWQNDSDLIFGREDLDTHQKYRAFFHRYIKYAADNPELYDLMFGRTIWKNNAATKALKDVAFHCFQHQMMMTKNWQAQGVIPNNENTLRLSQVTWGTMHGIARLLIDGIYADRVHIDEMCDCAVNLFTQQLSISGEVG